MKNTIFTIIIVFIIAGCAAKEKLEEMPVTQVAPQRLEVKGPPMEQLPLSQVVEEVKEREKLYSLSVKNMDVRNVLFIFSTELPEYNVVVDPDVEGIVTVDFKELPLDKALAFILEPLNLEYVIDEKVLRISKPRLETRTFEFVYSTSTRTARGALMAVTGGGGKEISGDEEGGGEEVTTAASFGSVETEDIINVWDELEAGIKDLMSDDGKLSTNKRVGYITVTDYRANLKGIEDLINFFKAVVKKQILIRAKILEITLTESSEFGIDWNVVLTRLSILGGKRGKIAGSLGTTARPTAFTQPFAPST
ncbi:MAG: secretin and TonB N-terminal domain-containing protein, partial [Candidatus Brocadiales bacterium]